MTSKQNRGIGAKPCCKWHATGSALLTATKTTGCRHFGAGLHFFSNLMSLSVQKSLESEKPVSWSPADSCETPGPPEASQPSVYTQGYSSILLGAEQEQKRHEENISEEPLVQQAQALVLCKQTLSSLMSENQPPDLHLKPSQQLASSGPAALEQKRGGYSTKQPPTRSLPSLLTTHGQKGPTTAEMLSRVAALPCSTS